MSLKSGFKLSALTGTALFLGALSCAPPVFAQAPAQDEAIGVGDIMVTAQRRSERLQDVPITVSPVSAQTLENAAISGTLDLSAVVPGLVTYQIGSASTPFIRGVGSNQSPGGFESSVALYLDGVYLGTKNINVFDLANVDRIEVLKGPQGTLFGRNATAGAISIITRDPGSEPEFEASLGIAELNERNFRVFGSAPLTDTLSANFAVNGRWFDGWIFNPYRGVDQNPHESYSASGVLLWEPNDQLRARLSANYTWFDEATFLSARAAPGTRNTTLAAGFITGGVHQSTSDHETTANQEQYNVALNVTYDVGGVRLVSITGYQDGKTETVSDSDLSNSLAAVSGSTQFGEEFTQEFQVQSNTDSDFSWIVGAHYMRLFEGTGPAGENFISMAGVPSPVRPDDLTRAGYCATGAYCVRGIVAGGTTESMAAFAQGTYDFTAQTSLTLGVRYGEEDHSVDGYTFIYRAVASPPNNNEPVYNGTLGSGGLVFDNGDVQSRLNAATTFESTTYRAALSHNFTEDFMVYGSYSTGFKSGAYNQITLSATAVNPEELGAWEFGFKSQLFDNRLRFNASYWIYDYSDIQVGLITGTGISTVQNAAAADLQGIDIDFEARPTRNLTLRGGLTALDSEYTEFNAAQLFLPNTTAFTSCPVPSGGVGITMDAARARAAGTATAGNYSCAVNASGERVIFAPELTGNVTAELNLPLSNDAHVLLSGTLSYTSSYDAAPGGIFAEFPSFENFNASATYYAPNDAWYLRLWGANITDDLHPIYISPQALGFQYVENKPRVVGLTFGVRFGG